MLKTKSDAVKEPITVRIAAKSNMTRKKKTRMKNMRKAPNRKMMKS